MLASEGNWYYQIFGEKRGGYYRYQQTQRHKSRLLKIIKKTNIKVEPIYKKR